MNHEMYEIMKDGRGFIAALDQSGGSSSKTLKAYGIPETEYNSEEEMFNLIHEMRKRVFTSKSFTNEHIIGAILFEKTMMSKVNDEFTADYLWNQKHIVSFLKVDKGLQEENNGVKLMKPIPELAEELREANEKHVFGTKMRSVIYEANREGIAEIVNKAISSYNEADKKNTEEVTTTTEESSAIAALKVEDESATKEELSELQEKLTSKVKKRIVFF